MDTGCSESVMIKSDGTPIGTKVITADDSRVGRIKSMNVSFEVDEFVKATIEVIAPVINTKAKATYEWLWLEEYTVGQLESLKENIDKKIGELSDK